jgi:hypothetical protein
VNPQATPQCSASGTTLGRIPRGREWGTRAPPPSSWPRLHALPPRRLLQARDVAGANTLHFSGRVGGHKLAPGPYRLETGAPSARFRITR